MAAYVCAALIGQLIPPVVQQSRRFAAKLSGTDKKLKVFI
jgi:hypothetical protein